jgi:hypothetical protein
MSSGVPITEKAMEKPLCSDRLYGLLLMKSAALISLRDLYQLTRVPSSIKEILVKEE